MNYSKLINEMHEVNRKKGTVPFELAERMAQEMQILSFALKAAANELSKEQSTDGQHAKLEKLYNQGKWLKETTDEKLAEMEKGKERTDKIDWLTERSTEKPISDVREEYPAIEAPCNGKIPSIKKSSRKNARAVRTPRADRSTNS